MNIVFLAGPIASGKSTVARYLQELGAWRIDLDAVSRAVTAPGTPCLEALADAFGRDVVKSDGSLDRGLLAERAFASDEAAQELEAIELPYILQSLLDTLSYAATVVEEGGVVVVEVPLLDRLEDLMGMADEILVIDCPEPERKAFAKERGVGAEDFARRQARQPSPAYLREHATTVLANDGAQEDLLARAKEWYVESGYEQAEPDRG